MDDRKMKPKTFTYNQIIQFFIQHRLPLNDAQVKLIAYKVRSEFEKIKEFKEKREAKKQGDKYRREMRKKDPERLARLEKFKNSEADRRKNLEVE
jgi:hypothetical protein